MGWGVGRGGNGQTGMDPAPLNLTATKLLVSHSCPLGNHETREQTGINSWDLYPGISAGFNQGNGERGREASASDTFCQQKSLCQHDALAEGAGQWWRLCPPAAARIPAPLPWKPPFCGEQQAL